MQEPINVKPFSISTPNLGGNVNNSGTPANPVSSFEGTTTMQDVNQGSGSSGGSASSNPTPQTISKSKAPLAHTAQQQTPATVVKNPQPPAPNITLSLLLQPQTLQSSQQPLEIADMMTLLKVIGHAYLQLCLYKCQEALKVFNKLTKKQYSTGWTLAQVARCQFEMAKYQEAEKMYKKVIQIEPYRLEGLEYYSTCLWHLKKQVDLCYLSNHALEKSLFAPETWCVVGNCYSL